MPWKLTNIPTGYTFSITQGGVGTKVVKVTAHTLINNDNKVRVLQLEGAEKWVTLECMPPERIIDSRTDDPDEPPAVDTYVGAFWRANETGERIIRIEGIGETYSGTWTASVVWLDSRWAGGKDRVVLSTDMSNADPNLWTDSPGNAENYQVAGYQVQVSGSVGPSNPDILFRIGLKQKFTTQFEPETPDYTNTWPARYALVMLSYNNSTKKYTIYLRQGEGADYLMRPGDPNGSNAAVADNRAYAKRFSPYNLTDPNFNTVMDYNAMVDASTGLLNVRGGAFVAYPTQAGYLFQFNNSRRAFNAFIMSPIANFSTSPGPAYWNPATDETCPETYRRPADGPNNTTAHRTTASATPAGSEVRQSLWLNPVPGSNVEDFTNSIRGYYADGFFDRRPIVQAVVSPGWNTKSSVSITNHEVAHIGFLLFNPTTKAAVFFPMGGVGCPLQGNGGTAYYWSSSSASSGGAWDFDFWLYNEFGGGPYVYNNNGNRQCGFSIRCVKE